MFNKYENVDFEGSMRNNDVLIILLYSHDKNIVERAAKMVHHTKLFLEYIYTGFSRN